MLPLIENGRDAGSEAVIVTDPAVLLLGRGGGGGEMLAMICVDECTVALAFYIGEVAAGSRHDTRLRPRYTCHFLVVYLGGPQWLLLNKKF